jgi:hypothetical protein
MKKKLPKENNRPMGENSPNLVALAAGQGRNENEFIVKRNLESISSLHTLTLSSKLRVG